MQTIVMDITPGMASEWLATKNTFNRRLSQPTVDKYASDMAAGEWRLNHQGIAFGLDGVLVDGQHRLQAVVRSGATVKMLVTFGADRVGIDELRVRSAAEVIKFGGLSDWVDKHHLAVAKQMLNLFSDAGKLYSTMDILAFANNHRQVIERTNDLFTMHTKGIASAGSRAVVAVAMYHFDRADIAEFVQTLYSGIPSDPTRAAAVRCRDMLIAGGFSGGSTARRKAAIKMSRAIVAFCERQPLKVLRDQSELSFNLPAHAH